jgi:hypothetical protein
LTPEVHAGAPLTKVPSCLPGPESLTTLPSPSSHFHQAMRAGSWRGSNAAYTAPPSIIINNTEHTHRFDIRFLLHTRSLRRCSDHTSEHWVRVPPGSVSPVAALPKRDSSRLGSLFRPHHRMKPSQLPRLRQEAHPLLYKPALPRAGCCSPSSGCSKQQYRPNHLLPVEDGPRAREIKRAPHTTKPRWVLRWPAPTPRVAFEEPIVTSAVSIPKHMAPGPPRRIGYAVPRLFGCPTPAPSPVRSPPQAR